ncbi:hypothetical protein BKA67DRAFT_19511 [Truncatella angustata]|uniref:Transcription initiation factor IIF subunit alpha n=1 Tax=Truncatella angustata TaxID=152316 RepID=A0A9P9A2Y8_9PEZI|nr:uncharacterized protein BKA67DRAFT_19511 [Truncatella angustata]KAH6659598.1 hypothetical protein BKA67DRAFT_19511 [Truncatella angustata]KAH8197111.1 hypothetical protein TruAng_008716 [Truncatella angustata]
MSASPAGGPNGQTPTPPQGKGPMARRRPVKSNPFRPVGKAHARPAAVHAPGTPMPAGSKGIPPKPTGPKIQAKPGAPAQPNFEADRQRNGGWSFPMREGMGEFDLVLTKKGNNDGMRSHVMRLVPPRKTQAGIDPSDQNEFTRPVLLHRRDPRQPPPGRSHKEPTPEAEESPEQIAERERLAQAKAERDTQKAIDDAQKAPSSGPMKKQPKQKDKPQGTKVNHGPRTAAQKKESEIRYEEALPWHLEDADGGNVWVGQYEQPLSGTKVAILYKDNKFIVTPLEKWYKFSSKRSSVNAMTLDEVEAILKKKAPVARWAMRDQQREAAEKELAASRGQGMVKQESRTYKQSSRAEKADHDDIDMSGDEFQDDDENTNLEADKDEDSKDAQEKVRRDQLGANLFGHADEKVVEKEEAQRRREELERKLFGKNMKKALKKRDKQFQYDDTDDSERERDPFASSSEEESDSESDEEKAKKEKEEKEKEAKDKITGDSSKGNNTPQGKKVDAAKKGKSLKRSGSPMVSDSSGNESTRKNKKKKLGPSGSSLVGSRSGTPIPRRPGAGSASDAEATGGEMSDGVGGRTKKKKIAGSNLATGTNARGTPVGSRSGSPAPASGARSPMSQPLTAQEIVDALPEDPAKGLNISQLLKLFNTRIGDGEGKTTKAEFIALVKQNGRFKKDTKTLSRKIKAA